MTRMPRRARARRTTRMMRRWLGSKAFVVEDWAKECVTSKAWSHAPTRRQKGDWTKHEAEEIQ